MNTDRQAFANALTTAREAKGLTQEQLGERIGMTQQAVARWESGTGFPRQKSIDALVNELGEFFPPGTRVPVRMLASVVYKKDDNAEGATPSSLGERLAFIRAFEEGLTRAVAPELRDHFNQQIELLPTMPVKVDYASDKLVLRIGFHFQRMHSNRYTEQLWRLSCVRRASPDDRTYLLMIYAPGGGSIPPTAFYRMSVEAGMHGITIVYVHSVDQAAEVISDVEAGRFGADDDEDDDLYADD